MSKDTHITVCPLLGHDIHSVKDGNVLLTLEVAETQAQLDRGSGRSLPVLMTADVARELATRLIEAGIYGEMIHPKDRRRRR